jgi:flagellin
MTVINTNIAASVTASAMKQNARVMENTMERLATGQRINSASDDAAGLAIGARMDAQIRGLSQGARNANDAISLLQTVDGAAIEIGDMLQRMRELSVQATNGTNDNADIANLNKEFAQLATEIDRVADDTKFNGSVLMNTGVSKSFTIGADQDDIVSVSIKDFNLAAGALTSGGGSAGTGTLGLTLAEIAADLDSAGIMTITDGTATITLNLTDVQVANNNGALTKDSMTMAQVATALNVKANANANFSATFSQTDDTGFTITEKSGFHGADKTYTTGGATVAESVALSTGTAGAAGGVYGVDISAYKASASSSVNSTDGVGVIKILDNAIVNLAAARADYGSVINRLEHSIDNLNSVILNTKAAKSAIMDADYAAETTELARTQIISQASTAMLSQANQQAQSVLALLK